MKYLLMFILSLLLGATCKKDDNKTSINYPEGIQIIDLNTTNNCNLSECSEERVTRLIAEDAIGTVIEDSMSIFMRFTFDSHILFQVCEMPEEFMKPGLNVKFSGKLRDACGVLEARFPTEEIYFLELSKIDSL